MVAALFVLYSIIEKMFSQFDSKFFLLLFMIGGAVFAKERGYFDQGLKKLEEAVAKIKKVWSLLTWSRNSFTWAWNNRALLMIDPF